MVVPGIVFLWSYFIVMEKEIAVPENSVGERLDVFLHRLFPEVSREKIKAAIRASMVRVKRRDGRPVSVKPSYRLSDEDDLVLSDDFTSACHRSESRLAPESVELDILYEDDYILAINKPAGMVVHPGAGVASGTLANAVLGYLGSSNLSDIGGKDRPGVVHRLDRETSGVILIAKRNDVHYRLSRLFEERKVGKTYLARVWGSLEFDEDVVDVPIERHPFRRQLFRVGHSDAAREAITEYRVLQRLKDGTSLLEVKIHTGRTHQIRVHMKHIGHPIVGDRKYGRKDGFKRMGLHAYKIEFNHPVSDEALTITAPYDDELFPLRMESNVQQHRG